MKKILILAIFSPLISLAQKTDFSGKWSLNLRMTDFGRVSEWNVPRSYDIKQQKDAMIIQAKFFDDQMEPHNYTERIPFDGKTTETLTYGDNKRVVSMKWNAASDGFMLTVQMKTTDGQSVPIFTEIWSLNDGDKSLEVDREPTQAEDYSIKAYYDKK